MHPIEHFQVSDNSSFVHRVGRTAFITMLGEPLDHLEIPIRSRSIHCFGRASFKSIRLEPLDKVKMVGYRCQVYCLDTVHPSLRLLCSHCTTGN